MRSRMLVTQRSDVLFLRKMVSSRRCPTTLSMASKRAWHSYTPQLSKRPSMEDTPPISDDGSFSLSDVAPDVAEINYSREESVAAIKGYFEFLTKMCARPHDYLTREIC